VAIITSYATLKTAVADYLARDDLTTFVPNFIQNAENKLYRTLNLRNEETALNVTISSGVAAVPSDFKALKYAYVDQSPVTLLQFVSPEEVYNDYPFRAGAVVPNVISRELSNFIFGPYPAAYTIKGIYYAKLSALSDSNTTNWYTTNAPELLLYGALLESAPFIGADERMATWGQLYQSCLETVKQENTAAEYSMGSLTQRVS